LAEPGEADACVVSVSFRTCFSGRKWAGGNNAGILKKILQARTGESLEECEVSGNGTAIPLLAENSQKVSKYSG